MLWYSSTQSDILSSLSFPSKQLLAICKQIENQKLYSFSYLCWSTNKPTNLDQTYVEANVTASLSTPALL